MYTKEVSGCFLLLSTEPPWLKEYLSKRWSADHLAEIAEEKNPPARYGVTEHTLKLELYMISMWQTASQSSLYIEPVGMTDILPHYS